MSMAAARISASGAPTNVVFLPSPIHLLTAFNTAMTGCHTNTATAPLSACHKAPVKTLPIHADLSWSPLPHIPFCAAAFSFFLSSYYILLQECWEGHEQALITTIRKETKRTEELEEAGYRSPTWAVLRALQQINSATRIEGEATMSAPPFFQSAGRGDLLFWGGKLGPTIVMWESLSEQEKKSWLEESSTMHDWVVWCMSKKRAEDIRSFELSGIKIFFKYDDTKSQEAKNKKNRNKKKVHRGQSVRYRSWWKKGNIKIRTTHDADAHSALKRCARGLECTQHSVHSKS